MVEADGPPNADVQGLGCGLWGGSGGRPAKDQKSPGHRQSLTRGLEMGSGVSG